MEKRELITSLNTSIELNKFIKSDTLFCWYKTDRINGHLSELRSIVGTINGVIEQIPAYTSEELKWLLISFIEDVSYSYEENHFYYIDWEAPLLNDKALPKVHTFSNEVEARANLLIYLLKIKNKKL